MLTSGRAAYQMEMVRPRLMQPAENTALFPIPDVLKSPGAIALEDRRRNFVAHHVIVQDSEQWANENPSVNRGLL